MIFGFKCVFTIIFIGPFVSFEAHALMTVS